MKNGVLVNRIFSALAIAFLSSLLFAASGLAADSSGVSINDQRLTIEEYYKGLIDEIQRRAESSVKESNDIGDAERQRAETIKRTRIAEDLHQERAGQLLSAEQLSEFEKERAQREKDIRTRAETEIKYLLDRKARELEAINGGGEFRRLPQGPVLPVGTVTGIVYYNNSGAALIGGEVVRENDDVMEVKIIKILPDYVEFEKEGKKWKQEVGQAPPVSVWEKEEKPKPGTQPSAGQSPNINPGSGSKPGSNAVPKPNPVSKPASVSKTNTGTTAKKAKPVSKDIR